MHKKSFGGRQCQDPQVQLTALPRPPIAGFMGKEKELEWNRRTSGGKGIRGKKGDAGDSPTVISKSAPTKNRTLFLLFSVGKQNFIKHARVMYTNLKNNRRKIS